MLTEHFGQGLANWIVEGPPGATVQVERNSLLLDPRSAPHRPQMGIEGLNLWCRTPIAGDWRMSFDLEPMAPVVGDDEKCNLLFMFNCRYQDPDLDLLKYSPQRSGSYIWLHGREEQRQHYENVWKTSIPLMDGYTITYYRMAPQDEHPYQVIARRNPGFHLLAHIEQTAGQIWSRRHHVHIEKCGATIIFFQENTVILQYHDSGEHGPALTEGYWGFRTWRSAVRLYGIRVQSLGEH